MTNTPEPGSSLPAPNSTAVPNPPQQQPSLMSMVFMGPNGIRAGWRLLIFFAILCALVVITSVALYLVHLAGGNRSLSISQLTPAGLGLSEATILFFVSIATLIMARIEHRKFGLYGLPFTGALGKRFWQGTLWGFLSISGTLLAIFALHGFRITGVAIHGATLAAAVAAWSLTFLIVGLSEEFAFRGYIQFTLTTGIRFWPAAFLLSGLFGLAHLGNKGETAFGLLSVVLFGLLFCLFLRRTGDLWLAVGFHAGWDWGQTFFYGVPDSGILPYHNFMNSTFSGPGWLTGGSVGPEASLFTPVVLLIVAILFSRRYRDVHYRPLAELTVEVTTTA